MTDEEKQVKVNELERFVYGFHGGDVPLPEAGGTAWVILHSTTGGEYHVTARNINSWDALQELVHTVQLAGLVLNMRTTKPAPPAAQPPHVPADQRIATEAGNPQLAAELKANADALPTPPDGKVWEYTEAREIRIEPKADGLVSVEFWNPNRQYADEYVKWKPENVMGLLKHVTTVPVNDDGSIKPASVTVPCRVYYTLGKDKTGPRAKPGSRWHDVGHVRPI